MVFGEKHFIRVDNPDDLADVLKKLKPFELYDIAFNCSADTLITSYMIAYRPLIDVHNTEGDK
jgi:hypothetical protein